MRNLSLSISALTLSVSLCLLAGCMAGAGSSQPSDISSSSVSSITASSVSVSSSSESSSGTTLIKPLFDEQTVLEPATQYETATALVTRFSDRGRDRHAKENHFQAYDHYLTFYWENRAISVEIIDEVAKGGNRITMNVKANGKLDSDSYRCGDDPTYDGANPEATCGREAENRWWYIGRNTLAEYCGNGVMDEVHELSRPDLEEWHYTKTSTYNCREGREIRVGDKMEFEISQFLDPRVLKRGRSNYYGTTYLYIVGEGLAPWDTYATGAYQQGVSEVPCPQGEVCESGQVRQRDSKPITNAARLGGDTTLHALETAEWDGHYMQMATNINYDNGQQFLLGRRVHHTSFVDGKHNESDENGVWEAMAGLSGDRYINDRCVNCHTRNGAAAPAGEGEPLDRYVVKVAAADGGPDADIGRVMQTAGVGAEGQASLAYWQPVGELRKPVYAFSPVQPAQFSVRLSPRLVGLGLLEAIKESDILALADPDDRDGDGISGRVNIGIDPETGELHIGRFGWKAGSVSLRHQIAAAFNTDMGVMTEVLPTPDCGTAQANCTQPPLLPDEQLVQLTKYIALLGVRLQRNSDDAEVTAGKQIFSDIGCADCHTPQFVTSEFHPLAELREQTIYPYTDLLLHDLGEGLADGFSEGEATGREWRTTPLWGLGNQACVTGGVQGETGQVPFGTDGQEVCNPVHGYLHDGRARTIEEAILWHGGEAATSQEAFHQLGAASKAQLLAFLNSL